MNFCILYRTNAQSRVFEEYLRRANLSYVVFGGLSFYQRKEVKDLVAYLRLILNKDDEEALRRVINYPKRGIGKTSVEKITAIANQGNQSVWDTMLQIDRYGFTARTISPIRTFVQIIQQHRKLLNELDAYEITKRVANASGILKTLNADRSVEGLSRVENLNALLDGIKDFVGNDELIDDATLPDKSLASYLQNIALVSDLDGKDDEDDKVVLMSGHAAKGLEFKSVFVVGLEENLFPSFMAMESREGLDEERRLFYVAITRAEQLLCLSYAKSRYRFGKMVYNESSRFLEEVGEENLEASSAKSGRIRTADLFGSSSSSKPFKKKVVRRTIPMIAPADFKPSNPREIQSGMAILHLRFGQGKILSVDGTGDKRVATIFFREMSEQKRIVLKYAKLQILTT